MHRDIVYDLPAGVQNLASSHRCEIQGLYKPGKICSVQGHPEFDAFITAEILYLRYNQAIFDKDTFMDGLGKATLSHNGVEVAAAMVRFLIHP